MCWHCDPIHINTRTIEPLATVAPSIWNERWDITQLTGEENCTLDVSVLVSVWYDSTPNGMCSTCNTHWKTGAYNGGGGKVYGKKSVCRPSRRWQDNIKIWIGFIWLRRGVSSLYIKSRNELSLPVPVAARSNAWVCGRSPAEICGFGSHRRYGFNICGSEHHSSEISPTRCNNCVFILRNGFTLHV